MARVVLTNGLTQFTGGERELELEAGNIRQLLRVLGERYPRSSRISAGLAVAIDGEIFQDAWLEPIPPGQRGPPDPADRRRLSAHALDRAGVQREFGGSRLTGSPPQRDHGPAVVVIRRPPSRRRTPRLRRLTPCPRWPALSPVAGSRSALSWPRNGGRPTGPQTRDPGGISNRSPDSQMSARATRTHCPGHQGPDRRRRNCSARTSPAGNGS